MIVSRRTDRWAKALQLASWHPRFAYFPTKLIDGDVVWWENIERRMWHKYSWGDSEWHSRYRKIKT